MMRLKASFVISAIAASLAFAADAPTPTVAPTATVTPVATPLATAMATPVVTPEDPLRAEMDGVVGKGPLHLRTRVGRSETSPTHWLLSFEPEDGGKLRMREITSRGEVARDVIQKMTKSDFLAALFKKDAVFEMGDGVSGKIVEPLKRSKLPNGTSKVSALMEFQFEKSAKPISLELYFDVLVMNFNPLNLWDANPVNTSRERLYGYDLFTKEFSNWYEPHVQKGKAAAVARVLTLAGLPEVVALQELEYANGLSEVFAAGTPLRRALEDLGYRTFLVGKQGNDNAVAITTGFISRYSLTELSPVAFNIKDEAFKLLSERERKSVRFSTRDTQVVEFSLGQTKARFFNTHWRSKGCSGEESCDLSERVRIVNAEVLKRHFDTIRKENPEVEIFVMGDFNSAYDDATLEKVGSSDAKKKIASGAEPGLFYNLWYDLPKEARWEHEFQGERNTLSQMLLSSAFFGTRALQYVDQSFFVLGQSGDAHGVLMNPNDTPLRWQEARLRVEEAPAAKRAGMKSILAERGCLEKKSQSKRKCSETYVEHIGVGYSDHLPQVARLSYVGDDFTEVAPQYSVVPATDISVTSTARCKEADAVAAAGIEFWKIENKGRCVLLDFSGAPQALRNRGVYNFGFVLLKGSMLGLTMNGAYNPKPRGFFGSDDSSDMCFSRKVLQHDGGKVVKALGRLGFDNGMPVVFLAERADVTLADLPKEKAEACR